MNAGTIVVSSPNSNGLTLSVVASMTAARAGWMELPKTETVLAVHSLRKSGDAGGSARGRHGGGVTTGRAARAGRGPPRRSLVASARARRSVPNSPRAGASDVWSASWGALTSAPALFLALPDLDASHNPSDHTVAGEHDAVVEGHDASSPGRSRTSTWRANRGAPPDRGGGLIPFVPLGDTSMDQCVELSRTSRRASRAARPPRHLYA